MLENSASVLGAWADDSNGVMTDYVAVGIRKSPLRAGFHSGIVKYDHCIATLSQQQQMVVTSFYSDVVEDPGQVVEGEIKLAPGEILAVRTHGRIAASRDDQFAIVTSVRLRGTPASR